jgi:hypothetical protein
MPTRPVKTTHDSHDTASPAEAANPAAGLGAEASAKAAKVESPAGGNTQGAAGPPHETNADDEPQGDQDIDTAGTAHDDESPTKRF